MYSELIYTRCRQGIDILKGGRPVLSDGFKVYSCSKDILDGDVADLPLLFNMAQSKQTYSDPNFMDDVYIYAVPDKGRNILVNFHPIPFDRDAKGDYSHRPGNFVNQVFVGGFGDVYPFELFGNGGRRSTMRTSRSRWLVVRNLMQRSVPSRSTISSGSFWTEGAMPSRPRSLFLSNNTDCRWKTESTLSSETSPPLSWSCGSRR